MTRFSDLVGGLGTDLVRGRTHADRASIEAARIYADEPLLRGARVPRMSLADVTIEVKYAISLVSHDGTEILVTPGELADTRPEHLGTLTLRFSEDDLEPPPGTTG